MNPAHEVLAQTTDGFYALATPPCEHGNVTILIAHSDFPMPLAVARHIPHADASSAAIGLVLAAHQGTLNPN